MKIDLHPDTLFFDLPTRTADVFAIFVAFEEQNEENNVLHSFMLAVAFTINVHKIFSVNHVINPLCRT